MKWTTDLPTEVGWYWIDYDGDWVEIAEFYKKKRRIYMSPDGDTVKWLKRHYPDIRFAGPLRPPEEEKI